MPKIFFFASRKLLTSFVVHIRTVKLPKTITLGGQIFFAAIQFCNVCRVTPTAAAA